MGVVKAKFEVDAKNGIANLNNFKKALDDVGSVGRKLKDKIDLLAHSFQALGGAFKGVGFLKEQIPKLIEANSGYERLQIQLTGLIATNTKNIDSMGRAMDASKKWALSTKEADRVLKSLNQTTLKTKFTLNEVAEGFSMFYATAANQGSRDEAVKAFDSIALAAQAVGKDMKALTPMFDSLATGTVLANSEMGYFMKMVGLTNEELKKANQNGKVFDEIIDKLGKYKDLSIEAGKGFDVAMGNLENSINELRKELGKPLFEMAIKGVNEFSKFLDENRASIVKFSGSLIDAAKSIGIGLVAMKGLSVGYAAFNSIVAFTSSVIIPAFSSQLAFATTSTIILQRATNLLKVAMSTFLPVAVITSLYEYFSTMKEIKNATKDSYIEISNWKLYTTEAVSKVQDILGLFVNWWKLYFVNLGEFFVGIADLVLKYFDDISNYIGNKLNSLMDSMTKFSNWASGLIGLDPVKPFEFKKSNLKEQIGLGKELDFYKTKKDEISRQNEELLKGITTNRTKTLIDAHNKEVDEIKKQTQKVGGLVDERNEITNKKLSDGLKQGIKAVKDYANERLNYQIEYYEKSGKYFEAWKLKEAELMKEFKKINLDKKTADEILKFRKQEYLDKFVNLNKNSFEVIKDDWAETTMSMAKAIEDNFFDFFTGKIRSFSDMFKKLGRDLISTIISPMAKNVSSGFSGVFTQLLGGNDKAYVSKLATSLGLTLANGVYAGEVNGTSVRLDSVGNVLSGDAAFGGVSNILSLAGNMNTVSKLFSGNTGIIESFKNISSNLGQIGTNLSNGVSRLFSLDTYKNLFSNIQNNAFASMSGVFGDIAGYSYQLFGNVALANGIANFGTNFSSALTLGGHIGSGFSAGLGTVAGAGLLGYGGGRVIGGLGDKLFNADTYASKYGSMAGLAGGAIGGLGASLGAFGSFAGPIGAGIGAVLGAVIGGFRGKTKVKDTGLQAFSDFLITEKGVTGNEIKNFVDKQKKSWFKKKSWTEYSGLSKEQRDSINKMLMTAYTTLEMANADMSQFRIKAGKWSKGEGLTDGVKVGIVRAMMGRVDVDEYAKLWKSLEDALKAVSEVANYRAEIEAMSKNNPVEIAKYQMDLLNKSLSSSLESVMDLSKFKGEIDEVGELNAKNFLETYNKSIKENFTPENVDLWKSLTEAYKKATQAQKAYINALLSYSQNIYDLMGKYFTSIGKNGDFTAQMLNEQLLAMKMALKYDLNDSEKNALGGFSFSEINSFFNSLSADELRKFLENGDYELRSKLLSIVTSYNEYLKVNLANTLKLIDETQKSFFESIKKQFELNLSILTKQLGVINKLEDASNKLRLDVFNTGNMQNLVYETSYKNALNDYKAKNYDSKAYDELVNSANDYAKRLKDSTSSYAEYSYKILLMANEIENIGGGDKISVEKQIADINELLKANNDITDSINLELKRQSELASSQLTGLESYFGKDSIMANGLRAIYNATIAVNAKEVGKNLNYLNLTPFADGGIVTAPTTALIGEAGYPEAVIPLKDGKGLKVDMNATNKRLENVEKLLINLLMNSNNGLRILRTADTGEGIKVIQ